MKYTVITAVLTLAFSSAFAHGHEKKKAMPGHDKEHQHVIKSADHVHEDEHHKGHDHKAHHPEHVDEVKKDEKKKITKER